MNFNDDNNMGKMFTLLNACLSDLLDEFLCVRDSHSKFGSSRPRYVNSSYDIMYHRVPLDKVVPRVRNLYLCSFFSLMTLYLVIHVCIYILNRRKQT